MTSHEQMRLAEYLSFFESWQAQNPHSLRTCYILEQNGAYLDVPGLGVVTELTDFCSECAKPIAKFGAEQAPPVNVLARPGLLSYCQMCSHPIDGEPEYDWVELQTYHDKTTFVPNANHIAFLIRVLQKPHTTSSSLDVLFELCDEWRTKLCQNP